MTLHGVARNLISTTSQQVKKNYTLVQRRWQNFKEGGKLQGRWQNFKEGGKTSRKVAKLQEQCAELMIFILNPDQPNFDPGGWARATENQFGLASPATCRMLCPFYLSSLGAPPPRQTMRSKLCDQLRVVPFLENAPNPCTPPPPPPPPHMNPQRRYDMHHEMLTSTATRPSPSECW